MLKRPKEFLTEVPDAKKIKREDSSENKSLETLSDLQKNQFDILLDQYNEIEYIKQNWCEGNWFHISKDIQEKIKSADKPANTPSEFFEREQWLNNVNEKIISLNINVNTNELELGDKKLTRFPSVLFTYGVLERYWQRLNILRLNHNALTRLPAEIGNLVAMRWLALDHNQLTSLPVEIGNLRSLRWLSLDYNKLTNLPDEFVNLQDMNWLHLGNNQLTQLPFSLNSLPRLQGLTLDNNPLTREQLMPPRQRMS